MSLHHIRYHKVTSRYQREFWLVSFTYVAKMLLLSAKHLHLLMLHSILNRKSHLIAKSLILSMPGQQPVFSWHAVVEGFWSVLDKLSLCRSSNVNVATP